MPPPCKKHYFIGPSKVTQAPTPIPGQFEELCNTILSELPDDIRERSGEKILEPVAEPLPDSLIVSFLHRILDGNRKRILPSGDEMSLEKRLVDVVGYRVLTESRVQERSNTEEDVFWLLSVVGTLPQLIHRQEISCLGSAFDFYKALSLFGVSRGSNDRFGSSRPLFGGGRDRRHTSFRVVVVPRLSNVKEATGESVLELARRWKDSY